MTQKICEFWNFVYGWVSLSSRNEIIRKQYSLRVVTSCNPNLCALLNAEKKDEVGNDDVTLEIYIIPAKIFEYHQKYLIHPHLSPTHQQNTCEARNWTGWRGTGSWWWWSPRWGADPQTPVHSTWTHADMLTCMFMLCVVCCVSAAHWNYTNSTINVVINY